jgi:hypothetical protein
MFDVLPGNLEALKDKNVLIWNKFGKDICKYYNDVERVGI